MRKAIFIAASTGAFLMASAATALAQSEIPPNPDDTVGGTVVQQGPGGTAFTGADIGLLVVAIVVTLAVGVGLLLAARRRAASAG